MVILLACATSTTFYADWDGDGFGDPWSDVDATDRPAGFVTNADDCDDTRADVYPGAAETCDGWDEDCDGVVDDVPGEEAGYADADGDGFVDLDTVRCGGVLGEADCDDQDASVNPAALDTPGDGVDSDCDGADDAVAWTTRIQGTAEDEALGGLLAVLDLGMDSDALLVDGDGYLARFDGLTPGSFTADNAADLTEVGWSSAVLVGDVGGLRGSDLAGYVYSRYRYELVDAAVADGAAWATTTSNPLGSADFDQDGHGDLMLGDSGQVALLLGPVAGPLTPDDAWRTWTDGCDNFGRTVLAVDLDGDALPELLSASASCTDASTLVLHRFDGDVVGGVFTTGDAAARYTTAALPDESLNFVDLFALGDLDGDGRDEAALGLAQAGGAVPNAGEVFRVADLRGEGALADLDTRWEGGAAWDRAGGAVTAGDFDGDGARDIAIGAPGWDGGVARGAVFVGLGPVAPGVQAVDELPLRWEGEAWGDYAGFSLAVGDLYGEDHDDLAVGAPRAPNGTSAGAVYVLSAAFFGR